MHGVLQCTHRGVCTQYVYDVNTDVHEVWQYTPVLYPLGYAFVSYDTKRSYAFVAVDAVTLASGTVHSSQAVMPT